MRTNKFHFPLSCYFRKNEPPDVDQPSFIDIAEALSQELKANGKDRTAKLYLMVAGCLTRFAGNNKLMLEDITPALLCRYDGYLLKLGRKPNTISSHMRNLRAIYNKAVRRGVIPPPQENLFSDVHTGTYPTLKRALNKEEMQALSNLADNGSDDGLDNGLDNGWDDRLDNGLENGAAVKKQHKPLSNAFYTALMYFLFCFHARGMAFIDLAFLKKNNIQDGYIYYFRMKTGKPLSIKITSHMEQILKHFSPAVKDSPYLFPIIHPEKGNERKQYETALTLQNRRLKMLGRMAGIAKILTTHVARHTWATIARKKNVPLAVISECLGHRDERTTIIYLDSLETSVIDDASELVSAEICREAIFAY